MAYRRKRSAKKLLGQVGELALAVPQVVAHRVARMARTKNVMSARGRQEWVTMITEKQLAFAQAWFAMGNEMWRAQQQLLMSWTQLWWQPAGLHRRVPRQLARQLGHAALNIVAGGIAPIHRTAIANARRLARARH